MSPTLDDHEGRLRAIEGVCAESRWRIEALERTMKKTAELLDRIESRVEHMEWAHEQSAAALSKRVAIMLAVGIAFVSPVASSLLAHYLR